MKIERGHVINARFPHASGGRGKKRPVVVVQTNTYNMRLRHAVVVMPLQHSRKPNPLWKRSTSLD